MVMDGKDGKSYLADGHFAQLEGIKEESTLLLRNFYKSEEIFLDMFEDEYRVITLNSIQSSMDTLKGHKSEFTIVNGETFRNNSIFLPAYSLTMWFMRSSKNFVKIAILKI